MWTDTLGIALVSSVFMVLFAFVIQIVIKIDKKQKAKRDIARGIDPVEKERLKEKEEYDKFFKNQGH